MSGGAGTKRPSESKDEGERESKRANAEESPTAWALVLEEEPERGQGAYKLVVVKMTKFECRLQVSHLEQSVKALLKDMDYAIPPRIDIYAENPFAQTLDEIKSRILQPQIRTDDAARPKENYEEIEDDHRGPSTPYYVLTSKLEKRVQVPMNISASQVPDAVQDDPQAQIETIFTDSIGRLTIKVRSLHEIGRFKWQVHDRFAHTFDQLDIPINPLSAEHVPYLIMDGLLNPDNLQHFVTDEQWSTFNALLSTGAFAIMGVSGIGKTRTVLEYLAETWGLLFIVDTNFNGGIKDFTVLFAFLGGQIRKGKEHREANEEVAQKAFLCVLLGRLMLFAAVLNATKNALTPLQWLWVQLYPSYMLRVEDDLATDVDLDTIAESMATHLMTMKDIGISELQAAIRRLTRSIMPSIGQHATNTFPCFIDEAQILLKQHEGCFPSTNGSQGRALFTEALRAFNTLVKGPVFSGTGMKMSAAISALASHVGEKTPGDNERIYSFLPLLMGTDCKTNLERYLNLSDVSPEDQATLVRVLSGRPRLSAAFIARALLAPRDRPLIQILNKYMADMTTIEGVAEKGSFYRILTNLAVDIANANQQATTMRTQLERAQAFEVEANTLEFEEAERKLSALSNMMAAIELITLRFAITGEPQTVPGGSDDVLQLIERGLCPLHREGARMTALVVEPIVVMAVCNYRGLASYQWYAVHASNESGGGFQFEPAIMIAIDDGKTSLFSEHNGEHLALEDHPLITGAGIDLPPQFCGRWRLKRLPGRPMGVVGHKEGITLAQWLANPTSTFYFPFRYTGPDLVLIVEEDCPDPQREAIVVFQMKQYADDLIDNEDLRHAIATTDIKHVCKRKNGKVTKSRKTERQGVLRFCREKALPCIGILVTYPGGSPAVTKLERDDYLFIAASGEERFAQMFTEDLVEAARNAKPSPRVNQQIKSAWENKFA